jgi:hypothetical protein
VDQRDPRFQRPAGQPEAAPLNFQLFAMSLTKLIAHMIKERAHGQVVISFHQGVIPFVEVQRKYRPGDIPQV